MKNFYTRFLLLLLLMPLCVFMGCEDDDEIQDTTPSIVFSTTRTSVGNIDLDAGTGPSIRGWAVAPAGLAQVSITADKTSGGEEILNVTNFDESNSERNGTAYEFNVLPSYSTEFTGITVTVIDVNNRTEQIMLDVQAIGGTAGPTITGLPEGPIEANVRPSVNIRPVLEGVISSHWGLASVTFIEVYGEEEEVVETVSDFGDTPNRYEVNKTPDYDKGLTNGMTGYKINAVDNKSNSSSYSVEVSVIDASAAPIVTFGEEMIEADLLANPNVTPSISGSVDAFEGLASLNFYIVAPGGDQQHGEEITVFEDNVYQFSFDDIPYGLGVRGFKVIAVDNAGQTTSQTLPISVIAEDPNLATYNNVVLNAQGNRNDAGVVTAYSTRDGIAYTLEDGLDPAVSGTIDFITADSGGDNKLDLFSPFGNSWLTGNYFKKDTNGDMMWPVLNETRMRILDANEVDFATATSLDIEALELGDSYKLRLETLEVGGVAMFVTSEGKKGLVLYEATDNADGKVDQFTFDFKVVK